ncbi:MAG TPA: ImcF-related family protein [Pseudomonas sp.]|jgi:type VI secretion system protein ImpL
MSSRRSAWFWILITVVMFLAALLCMLVWQRPGLLNMQLERGGLSAWWLATVGLTLIVLVLGFKVMGRRTGPSFYGAHASDDLIPSASVRAKEEQSNKSDELRQRLRRDGPLWRRKTRLLLIVGEPEQVEAIAPGLTEDLWQKGQDAVLLWGGRTQEKLEERFVEQWAGLTRWRPLDGVVWALNQAQSADAALMRTGVDRLQALANVLHWQVPLYLWQVCTSDWPQTNRPSEPVGCRLPARFTPEQLESFLGSLLQPMRQKGLAQIEQKMAHDFLFRLSYALQTEGIARWRQALTPLLATFARGVPLRGLWFSLAPSSVRPANSELKNLWLPDPAWLGVLGDKTIPVRRLGWPASRIAYALMLCLALVWGAGMLLSFASNRTQIAKVQASLAAVQQSGNRDQQLSALNELVRELARLDYRMEHGAVWFQRFGLNQNQALLDALWPRYVEANNRLMRDPAADNLQRQLKSLVRLAPDSPERAARAHDAYLQLKAYLMMARPEKVDAGFLAQVLGDAEPARAGVSPGLWQGLAPGLWKFYSQQLAAHPHWRIEPDLTLIAQARRVLLNQLGQRNAEASLYQKVLDAAASQAPALTLHDMVGDTDAMALLASGADVPGVFTRQAWEGQVRQAIEDIADARREQIDWVLSDRQADIAAELTPDMLRERLTERYFQDYSSAWLAFLNSLRWNQAHSLAEVIDQLTLMSDVRQSPLIALMNTLAWQGQAGIRQQALTDSLIQSAQQLIKKDLTPVLDPLTLGPRGPLDATFGPLLTLLGKGPEGAVGNDSLSLQAFLTRVTRVRLKLQQISNAPDPLEMTQALAQTVFQGNSVEITDTQSYGRLMAASLGAEWGGIGQTLFVQPLDQAWKNVLQPSAASLNKQWQRAVVSDWDTSFTGRYPFAATASDISLPMLGQMIRADSGRIEQFLQRQLSGVLRKEGSQWVADTRHSQGLRLNPQFLTAINQLSHLGDVLYTDGGMGLSFELQGKAVRDVVQTTFILNGEKHEYFNQKPSWQRFTWPGRSDYPGASLSWISVHTGERLFGDYQGTWGLIRLLEKAQVTLLDDGDSRYRMVLKAPDGLSLTWDLRTELGAGPLALLKLRGFKMPKEIFLVNGASKRSAG